MPVTGRRRIAFQMGMGTGGMAFTIDGRTFGPERYDQTVTPGFRSSWTDVSPESRG